MHDEQIAEREAVLEARKRRPATEPKPIGSAFEAWKSKADLERLNAKFPVWEPSPRPTAIDPDTGEEVELDPDPPITYRPRPTPMSDPNYPLAYEHAHLTDFHESDFVSGDFPDVSTRRSILVCGPNGVGKTHFAAVLYHLWNGKWCDASWFVSEIRATWARSSGDTETQILTRYTDPSVLVIDDIAAVQRSDFVVAALFALLDRRIKRRVHTVVTTNATRGAIENLDPSIASRLGGFERIVLVGNDRRKRT